jgi:transposase
MKLVLTSAQRKSLLRLRDHNDRPYVRERASAILKLADGMPVMVLSRSGLLRPRARQTIHRWVSRFLEEGEEGLLVKAGRGRKPAFFPLSEKQ